MKDSKAKVPIKGSEDEETKSENDKENKNAPKKKKGEKRSNKPRSKSSRSKKSKKNVAEHSISKIEHYKEQLITAWEHLVAIKESLTKQNSEKHIFL